MNTYQQRLMDSLTDEAINIIKKFTAGEELSINELIFLREYRDEIRQIDKPSLSTQISQILNYVKKFWASTGIDTTDDYVINTNFD